MIFDSHAHYDDRKFNADRDELLSSMHENGVDYIVNSGESLKASKAGVELGKNTTLFIQLPAYTQAIQIQWMKMCLKRLKKLHLCRKLLP